MEIVDLLVIAFLVLACVIAFIWSKKRKKKSGGCCGNCSQCSGCK